MPAPGFGYSIGDLIAVGQLAWKLYKRCKTAPESFYNISSELVSLHAVLKEWEDSLSHSNEPNDRRARLNTVVNGCKDVLNELDAIVTKFESLGAQQKRTWDRMRWHSNDIAEIRARITSHVTMLTAMLSISQARVQQQLESMLRAYKNGSMESSVVTTLTTDTVLSDQGEQWRQIRRDLEDNGITVDMFNANKNFIFAWIATAVNNGDFEEEKFEAAHENIDTFSPKLVAGPSFDGPITRSSDQAREHMLTAERSQREATQLHSNSAINRRERDQHLLMSRRSTPMNIFSFSMISSQPLDYIMQLLSESLDLRRVEYITWTRSNIVFLPCTYVMKFVDGDSVVHFRIIVSRIPVMRWYGIEFSHAEGNRRIYGNIKSAILTDLKA